MAEDSSAEELQRCNKAYKEGWVAFVKGEYEPKKGHLTRAKQYNVCYRLGWLDAEIAAQLKEGM
jgi:hypothetical protein